MNPHPLKLDLVRASRRHAERRLGLVSSLVLLLTAPSLPAATFSQTLSLQPGWNAVWIDPSPLYTTGDNAGQAMTVGDVFTSSRVTAVARPLLPAGSAEFVSSSTSVFNQEEWLVWYRNPQSLINTLTTVSGNQAYYVKVEGTNSPITVNISGKVGFVRPSWVPGSYNLLGFNLRTSVSFADFFGAAGDADGNHPINALLRLDPATSEWTGVQLTDLMHPGEAYWILSVRNSSFSGPVAITFGGFDTLSFGDGPGDITVGNPPVAMTSREVTFSNIDDIGHPLALSLVTPTPASELRIYEIVPGSSGLSHSIGPAGQISSWNIGQLNARTTRTITLGAQRNWTSGDPSRENLYRIDVGPQFFWLPASAMNRDVVPGASTPHDGTYAGLWVGDVLLDSVGRLTNGSSLAPVTSTATMQVIIHVDGTGAPSLLGHVMVMKTKTADPGVPSEEVLVLDETKIPYFEGIETRGGKRVGRRIESVAYDLPRNDDPTVQSALRDEVAAADPSIGGTNNVTAAEIHAYLSAQTSRPRDLVESYHLRWPLEGSLGPGAVVRTSTNAPLTLDPFHRSNPFRHAYHPNHAAGYPLTRSLTIAFDSTQAAGLLQGTYQESITGLAAHAVTARGKIVLNRISSVTQTQ